MKALVVLDLPNYRIGAFAPAERGRIAALETMFEALTRINMAWLKSHKAPLLYQSGVRYRIDPERGDIGELWLDAPSILARGFDDCEGLSSFLAAELRCKPQNSVGSRLYPAACVRLKKTRMPGMLHAIVYDPETRQVWDPSRALGMSAKKEA
jgi:hypothetical protein